MSANIQVGFRHKPSEPHLNPGFYDAGVRVYLNETHITKIEAATEETIEYYQSDGSSIGEYSVYDFVGEHISIYILDLLSTVHNLSSQSPRSASVQLEPWDFELSFSPKESGEVVVSFDQRYPESGTLSIPSESITSGTVTIGEFREATIEAAETVLQFAKNADDQSFEKKLSTRINQVA